MATNPSSKHNDAARVPLAVWPVAQVPAQQQRAGRYDPGSALHPGKMLPALAARVVAEYSAPGDLVVDPMCGIGTTLVEAALLGRRCIGVELEERWAALAEANVERAVGRELSPAGLPSVLRGDARALPDLLGDRAGRVDLILVSPPYGCDTGVIKWQGCGTDGGVCRPESLNYSADRANLGHARGAVYDKAMLEVYAACHIALRDGGILVTVTKNSRHRGRCNDLATTTIRLARAAGFSYLQHVIALLGPVREGALSARPSFWQIIQTRKARGRGEPAHLVVHEDACVFQKRGVGR